MRDAVFAACRLQHRNAEEGDHHELLYSTCVLDLTIRPEDYWRGKAEERVEQMRAREGGAGFTPPGSDGWWHHRQS